MNQSDEFGGDEIVLASLARALAHPARVRILNVLAERNSCICGEIVEIMPLSQATVSQHLKELKKAGLIHGEIEGPRVCYCLNREKLIEAGATFRHLFQTVDCCKETTVQNENEIKEIVKEKYGAIASGTDSCCSSSGCSPSGKPCYSTFNEDYSSLDGYEREADLSLGCGIPTDSARIAKGDTVLDLGSGAGNDVFVVRRIVGESGEVIGLDMTPEMIAVAENNASKLGLTNVRFLLGEIEAMPVDTGSVDVVVSNCVLNLVPDKSKAYTEILRVLKRGGHFTISDVVVQGELPEAVRQSAEAYAGCVAGAMEKEMYLDLIRTAGFDDIQIHTIREIEIPDDVKKQWLDKESDAWDGMSDTGIFSITLSGTKPPVSRPGGVAGR